MALIRLRRVTVATVSGSGRLIRIWTRENCAAFGTSAQENFEALTSSDIYISLSWNAPLRAGIAKKGEVYGWRACAVTVPLPLLARSHWLQALSALPHQHVVGSELSDPITAKLWFRFTFHFLTLKKITIVTTFTLCSIFFFSLKQSVKTLSLFNLLHHYIKVKDCCKYIFSW